MAAQAESDWRDTILNFDSGADSDADADGDREDVSDLSSSAIQDPEHANDDDNSGSHDEEASSDSDDDDRSGEGSQGTYGRVSRVFVDASFNEFGTSVRRALHGNSFASSFI